MFSIPMALLLLELKGPDFFLVGLFPGIIKDWETKEGHCQKHFQSFRYLKVFLIILISKKDEVSKEENTVLLNDS